MEIHWNTVITIDALLLFSSEIYLLWLIDWSVLFSFSLCGLSVVSVIVQKVRDNIFDAIFSPSERYQNIQDNPEYNSVLSFRIKLKIFAVNMLGNKARHVSSVNHTTHKHIKKQFIIKAMQAKHGKKSSKS